MLSKSVMRMLATFGMSNSGGSDKATIMQRAVAWKVLFIEIDLEISNEQLVKGTPCKTTPSNSEFSLAGDCYLMVAD